MDFLIRLPFEIIKVSILDWDGSEYNAFYDSFVIGSEDKNFPLYVSGYESENSTLDDGFAAAGQLFFNQECLTGQKFGWRGRADGCVVFPVDQLIAQRRVTND